MGSEVATEVYVLDAPRSIARQRHALLPLPPDWVRVRFRYCGICGSDLSKFEGRRELSYPASVGHEFVAEIEDIGSAVHDLSPGDVVTSDLNYRCGSCDRCMVDDSHLCRHGQVGHFTNRAFATRADLHRGYLLRLDSPATPHLALAEPLACAIHASNWARLDPEDRVLVVGCGGLGLVMAFCLVYDNPGVTFEVADVIPGRVMALAETAKGRGRPAGEASGEYDVVFDLSGTEEGLIRAARQVRPGGRLCSMSHLSGKQPGGALFGSLMRRDIAFKLSYLDGPRDNLERAAHLLQTDWDERWDSLIEVLPLQSLSTQIGSQRADDRCKMIIGI